MLLLIDKLVNVLGVKRDRGTRPLVLVIETFPVVLTVKLGVDVMTGEISPDVDESDTEVEPLNVADAALIPPELAALTEMTVPLTVPEGNETEPPVDCRVTAPEEAIED